MTISDHNCDCLTSQGTPQDTATQPTTAAAAAVPHLDDAVWHAHLLAQCGQPHHQLNGVHVVGNHHQLRLAALNQSGHVVEAKLDHQGLLLLKLLQG
jgi:hypothetical protein